MTSITVFAGHGILYTFLKKVPGTGFYYGGEEVKKSHGPVSSHGLTVE